ncbi:MAG: hypothetical protein KBS91_01610 [Firmicutes bacterium]|nr:hypothetical protein [Candidatus Caballimonas caccae]
MAFFKSKQEKEIEAQMVRDEQLEIFNDQIKTMQAKRDEYAKIAAEAEINGDTGTYDVACNALIELNDVISGLTQTKANFDIINVSNSIAISMATAMSALDAMASNKAHLPNIKKIQKANAKVAKYMRSIKISQKAMSSAMKSSNPANKARTSEEIDTVRPMIAAARGKLTGSAPVSYISDIDISGEINAEKNRII